MTTQVLLMLGATGLLVSMAGFKFKRKEKNELDNLQSIETRVYDDKNSSEFDKELASIRLATEYWKRNGGACYDFVAVDELPDSFFKDMKYLKENGFQSNGVFDIEKGMRAELIPAKFLDYYLLCKYPEYKADIRDQKINQILGI